MKRYRLLKDLPTFNKGDTFRLTEHGHLMSEEAGVITYAGPTLEKFNILDSGWFEEIPESKRWRAEKGGLYWFVDGGVADDYEQRVNTDDGRYELGNYFKTEEEAQKASDWLKAFAILRDDTKGFKPDWENDEQTKWCVLYDHGRGRLREDWHVYLQEGVIYFATRDDALESIKAHEREWLTFLNCGGGEVEG